MKRFGLSVFAVLLAASAGAQPFEGRLNAGASSIAMAARQARASMARRKKEQLPALPAKINVGGPKDKHRRDELKLFASGWKAALEALREQPNCGKFFADHGYGYDQVVQTLQATDYSFEKLGHGIGAETLDKGTVFINSDGLFTEAESGNIELNKKHYDLEETYRVRAMILLHELGHQLGIFGVDAGPDLEPVNAAHSLDIIRNCLPGDGDATPKNL